MNNSVFNKYFLAANSGEGFISFFKENYDNSWTAYIIKGGAGTGKSTLMRRFAAKASAKGIRAELCPCSSDPDSLDAVILPDRKIIILDGTPPHAVEPEWPGISEKIINTGDYWSEDKLKENREGILAVSAENKAHHKRAAAYIAAAGQLKRFSFDRALALADLSACFNFGTALAARHIKEIGTKAKEWQRFLGGVTPKGLLSFDDTLNSFGKKIALRDEYGVAASVVLSAVRDIALSCSHEIITIKNPILPSLITDALLIPALDLAFIREQDKKFESVERRHNLHRFYNAEGIKGAREKMKFNQKAYHSVISSAAENLEKAKAAHDRLEKYYIEAMDYERLGKFFDEFLLNAF